MSATERKLRGLKNRKRSIIMSFTAIKAFVSGYQPERDKCEVPVRLENLIALWDEFNTVQTELETMEEENEVLETYLKERMELERKGYASVVESAYRTAITWTNGGESKSILH